MKMARSTDAMTTPGTRLPGAPPCEVAIGQQHGWRRHRSGEITLWFKGAMHGLDGARLAKRLADAKPELSPEWIGKLLTDTDGHYAFAAIGPGFGVAAVDWVRSIPLAAAQMRGNWVIDDQPERLRRRAGLGPGAIDRDAALAIGMAGYTIDDATLYRGLELLVPGELIWFGPDGMRRHRYYIYRPWLVRAGDSIILEKELAETTLAIMEKMLASLDGRPLLVPLSAGRDSRAVASVARHLGYANVRCFTYGRAGNFEANASRAIAERLGYPWTFVPATIGSQRRFFASETYERYLDSADSCASVPFVQDMAPLIELKRSGYLTDDAVIANGNSGDFISGNHILPQLCEPARALDAEARWRRIIDGLIGKHFSLWRSLATPEAKARIAMLLRRSIERAGGTLGDPEADHGLYEYAEFQDRQCRYVVTGQRIYEFLGHEWRLPLWDNAYLRFWEGVPLAEKAGQALYARMLYNADWGGVWRHIPVNRKTVRPRFIIPFRLLAKALHAPLGPERWHRFERRYLHYWMEATANTACVPYSRVWRDRRGARHHIAWLAELYLARHGIDLDTLAEG
jgi:asparagine synthase (glutamine-hydrolysing)